MFKSKIEIREFAIKQSVALLGCCAPQKDVVAKAKEIEEYILGDADLPEVHSEMDAINGIMGNAVQMLQGISVSETPTEEKPSKKK